MQRLAMSLDRHQGENNGERESASCQKHEGGHHRVGICLRGDQIVGAGNERQALWAGDLAHAVCCLAETNSAPRQLYRKDLGRIG